MQNSVNGDNDIMTMRDRWMRISGICGIITPIVAFTCILLAIALAPQFSWTDNALSDLGIVTGATSILFNLGLILSGILTLLFASGLFTYFRSNSLGRLSALILVLDSLALTAIGVFPENVKPMHLYASVAFFVLFPISMLFVTASFLRASRARMGLLTLSIALFAAIVWIAEFLLRYVPGVAIPETLSALAASLWTVVLGFKMARTISSSNEQSLASPVS